MVSMRVAGVKVSASAAAQLAYRLHEAGETDLAQRVGIAVDTNLDVGVAVADRRLILRALEDCPDDLVELRELLRR